MLSAALVSAMALVVLFVAPGCDKKMDLSSLPQSTSSSQDTSYVRLDPPFTGFTGPEDILIGKDQLLYVADTKANRIVMLNRAGTVLSERFILHPRSVSQDTRLDLLVGGEVVTASGDTAGAIFRLHLVSTSSDTAHHLEVVPIDTVWKETAHPSRRFPGITVLSDNTYLVVRDGDDNSSLIDPDGRVMEFDADDNYVTPMPSLVTGTGTSIYNINHPTGITAFPSSRDFIMIQSSDGIAYGALWMYYSSTSDYVGWLPKFDPSDASQASSDFIHPNRYVLPSAVAIDPSRKDIFIADASLDSVFKFNSKGTFKSESFGAVRSDGVLHRPTGLAFYSSVLYVLDGDAGAVYRYMLSTDVSK